jgi:hypothetical protein
MERITQDEFKKRYGDVGLQSFVTPQQKTSIPSKNLFGRVSDVISNAGQGVRSAIKGEGEFAGQSPITRGFSAASSAALAIPQTLEAVAPEPLRAATQFVGEKVGKGFDVLTDEIASTKLFSDIGKLEAQGFINPQDNPEFYRLKEQLSVAKSSGDVASSVLSAQGAASTLQKGVDVTNNLTKVARNSTDAFGEFRPTTQQIAIERGNKIRSGFEEQNTRLKSADKAYNKNTIVRKLSDGTEKTITPIDTFADNDIAPVIEKGSIQMGDYKTGTGPLGKIKEKVQALDTEIDTNLVNSGQRVPIDELQERAIAAVKANPDLKQAGTVSQTVNKIQQRFEDYRMSYGDDIDIAELNNIRKVANRDWKPETQDTSRIVGDVARDYVYDAVEDNIIKDLLQKQGELLAAKKYAEVINGTKVTGGRLGNYAMRTGGAILGSTIEKAPVIGPAIGMVGGEAVSRFMQQGQFKSAWTELRALIAKEGKDATIPKKKGFIASAIDNLKSPTGRQGGHIGATAPNYPKPKPVSVSSDNLITKAKKYKSAEEFVKANRQKDFSVLTNDIDSIEETADKVWNKIYKQIQQDPILKKMEYDDRLLLSLDHSRSTNSSYVTLTDNDTGNDILKIRISDHSKPRFGSVIKEGDPSAGIFDSIKGLNEYADSNVADDIHALTKTKSQLTDIWNKANESANK